jgi:hypothetical protein
VTAATDKRSTEQRLDQIEGALGALASSLLSLGPQVVGAVRDNDLLYEAVKAHREQASADEQAALAEQRARIAAQRAEKEARRI